ncbi:MAG: LptF/LptG family permease [Elusimicrobia bacterium]|nr:LptF/LptG family permease [Elusimicrobiota bacterium]
MKIFSVYMAKRFFKPFGFGLGLFAILLFLGTVFDRMSALVKSPASIEVILEYLWLEVPYWAIRTIPMATLLATLVAMTGFVQSGEALAAQAAGFRLRDFWKPILWCSLAVAVLSFAAQETILPFCYRRSRHLWTEKIRQAWEFDKYLNLAMITEPGQFVQAKLFLPKQWLMEGVILERVGAEGITRQIEAEKGSFDSTPMRWVFFNGIDRTFHDGKVTEKKFKKLVSDMRAAPQDLIPRTRSPEEMSLFELRRYAPKVKHLGVSPREYMVAAHSKLSFPMTNVVICALGIPVALRLRRAVKILSFSVALGVSFLFLWFMEMSRALGVSGRLPPPLAAWTANILFGAIAAFLIRRYDV